MGETDAPKVPIQMGNPWPTLQKLTTLKDDPLKFDQRVALECAKLAANAIGALEALQKAAKELEGFNDDISGLPSGKGLAAKFRGTGTDAVEILRNHTKVMQNMMDTFVAAGKTYDAAEAENEKALNDVKVPKGVKFSDIPQFSYGKLPEKKFIGEFADPDKGLTPTGAGFPFYDNPYDMTWRQLYDLGTFIRNYRVPGLAVYHAGLWEWAAGKVEDIFREAGMRFKTVTADQWTGQGAAAAHKAVNDYMDSIPALQSSMKMVAANYKYMAGWLDATQVFMPPQPEKPPETPPVTTWVNGRGFESSGFTLDLKFYQDWMRDTYNKGLPPTVKAMPVLPQAMKAFDATPIPPDPTKADPGKKDKRITPSGPGRGPGPGRISGPTLTPQQRRQQQDIVRRQQDAQRRQDALQREAERRQRAVWKDDDRRRADAAKFEREQREIARKQQQENIEYQRQQRGAAERQQQENAEYQRQQRAEAERQQQQQAVQRAAQEAMSAGQQGLQEAMSAGQQGLQQAMSAAQQAAQQAMAGERAAAAARAGIPGMNMPKPGDFGKLGAGGPGGGAGGGIGASPGKELGQASKLFPRAGAAATGAGLGALGRGATGPMAAAPGSPGPAGAAGRGADGANGDKHKRPAYLESTEHLEESLGEAPRVVKPVIEK
ncbi:hypothetical protein [Nocardia lijiangensis]|uniref:hypothetical protein n=1 Tax=Nocardia lijiangensis TaxID=299618 RepID=UPI003D751DE4